MAVPLRPEGIPVNAGFGVRIRTPGLRGQVEVYPAGSPGMRGAEDSTAALLDALARQDMAEQITVEISRHSELDQRGGTRAAGGGTEIELEVGAPGEGFGQVLLYSAEDGSITWHLPDDIPAAEVPQRGGVARTYRIPRAISAAPQPGDTGQRGLLGALGSKLLKVLIFPLIDPLLGAVGSALAGSFEKHKRRNLVRSFTPDDYRSPEGTPLRGDDWRRLTGEDSAEVGEDRRALLFVHGTMSTSHGGFGSLPQETLAQLHRRYRGRVFAFDHFTLSKTPTENAEFLAAAIPPGLDLHVDIVSHSRGGLVGRAMSERGAQLGLAGTLTVENLVMVGTPNAGTALADPGRLKTLLDRMTALLQIFPDNGLTDTLDVILTVLKQLAVGAFQGLDGIMAMNPAPESALAAFNRSQGSAARYFAVAANYDPPAGSPLLQIARDGATDIVFRQVHNDLVVPTDGVFDVPGAPHFRIADKLVFDATAAVSHSTYWGHDPFSETLVRWLARRSSA